VAVSDYTLHARVEVLEHLGDHARIVEVPFTVDQATTLAEMVDRAAVYVRGYLPIGSPEWEKMDGLNRIIVQIEKVEP
jgi:hypothetical protein